MSQSQEVQKGQLAQILDYQENAIVSREILKKPTGTVILFAFDKVSEHSAPFNALVQVLEGKIDIRVSGQLHLIKSGEYIIMPANEPHALKALTTAKMLLTMIKS